MRNKLRELLKKQLIFLRPIMKFPAFTSIAKILWGILLLNPLTSLFSNNSYKAMQNLFFFFDRDISELVWGILLITLGSVHLYATIQPKYTRMRFITDHISIGFWLFLGVAFLTYNPVSAGPYFYIYIALYEFIYIRMEIDQWYQEL